MGLWSTSKSASSTLTNTQNTAFSDLNDSTALSLMGSGHNVNIAKLDAGAIKGAFDFAAASNNASLDLVKNINSSTSRTIAESISAVSESARSESENVVLQIQRTAFYGLLAWGAVTIITKSMKG